MSKPGQNDVPAPVSTPTRTAGSVSAAASTSKYRFSIAAVHAFRRSGRFRVNVATPFCVDLGEHQVFIVCHRPTSLTENAIVLDYLIKLSY